MQEINLIWYVVFHLRRNTTNFQVKTEDGRREIIMETLRDSTDYLHHPATTSFGRLIVTRLRK